MPFYIYFLLGNGILIEYVLLLDTWWLVLS